MEGYKKSFNPDSYRDWRTQDVEEVFNIKPLENDPLLKNWLDVKCEITGGEQQQLDFLKKRLISKVSYWNEAAIKFYFIGPLMNLVDYDNDLYNSFLEQTLSITLKDKTTVSGNLDFLVATGKQIPRVPLFALHEYKPEPNTSTDPMGQLLIAMIAAQAENKTKGHNFPLYGTYVVGRLWFFVVLNGKKYSKSLAYDATQEDLNQIFCILKKVNQYITSEIA